MLIYQEDRGGDNIAKTPLGGIILQSSAASSMLATIANPITFYAGSPYTVIDQAGHSGDLYNYYWTSYSRGTDGKYSDKINEPNWHNAYLDGYIPLRAKSIYDPCPYLYRIPSNGTYNQFKSNPGWTLGSYLGGASWNMTTLGKSWIPSLGRRSSVASAFEEIGREGYYRPSTPTSSTNGSAFYFNASKTVWLNYNGYHRSLGLPVRCIEGSLRSAFFSTVVDN